MRTLTHLIAGLILAILLFFISPFVGIFEAIFIFIASFGIDIDYLLYYFYRKKSFSLSKTYRFAKENGLKYKKLSKKDKKKYFIAFRVFHGIETLIILFLLGYLVHALFYFALIGALLHLAMDWIHEIRHNLRHDKLSIILSYLRFKKLKQIN